MAVDPRTEARERIAGRFETRVLEPSPVPVTEPWFADDPVNAPVTGERPVVSPVPNGGFTWDELAAKEPELAEWCADRWLGAWKALDPIDDLDVFTATRRGWHAVAEHVVAPARHRANTKIGLRFTRGGFGTPFFADGGLDTQVRVEDTDLVVVRGSEVTIEPIEAWTAGSRARDALLEPADADLGYPAATVYARELVQAIDPDATRMLAGWIGFACSVLEELRCGAADAQRTRVQLWPEHFDLSIDLGDEACGQRGTYGASPGDDGHPEPYLYVTHWSKVPPDPFWNDVSFDGASLSLSAFVHDRNQRATPLQFFEAGRTLLGADDD